MPRRKTTARRLRSVVAGSEDEARSECSEEAGDALERSDCCVNWVDAEPTIMTTGKHTEIIESPTKRINPRRRKKKVPKTEQCAPIEVSSPKVSVESKRALQKAKAKYATDTEYAEKRREKSRLYYEKNRDRKCQQARDNYRRQAENFADDNNKVPMEDIDLPRKNSDLGTLTIADKLRIKYKTDPEFAAKKKEYMRNRYRNDPEYAVRKKEQVRRSQGKQKRKLETSEDVRYKTDPEFAAKKKEYMRNRYRNDPEYAARKKEQVQLSQGKLNKKVETSEDQKAGRKRQGRRKSKIQKKGVDVDKNPEVTLYLLNPAKSDDQQPTEANIQLNSLQSCVGPSSEYQMYSSDSDSDTDPASHCQDSKPCGCKSECACALVTSLLSRMENEPTVVNESSCSEEVKSEEY